ncbi:MAG: sulfite exporter TauE/SafE family protein [Candidatus Hodarchaeota archaeon]
MNLTWDIIIILLIFGFLFGLLSIISGQGGGLFYVSFMTIFLLIPINISIDTSNFIILLTSASGFLTYLKDKRTNLRLSLIYSGFSILGCLISTLMLLLIQFDSFLLRFVFATVLVIIGIYMVYKSVSIRNSVNYVKDNELLVMDFTFLKEYKYKTNLKRAIPLFLLAGFTSNLLGLGGGVIAAPALNLVLNFPIHYATGISTSIVFFTAIYNSITKFVFRVIEFQIGLLIGIGSIFGGFIGAKFSKKIPTFYLQLIVAIILILFAFAIYF